MSSQVGLDVGGVLYYTDRRTLTAIEGTYFARRFEAESRFAAEDERYAYDDPSRQCRVYAIDRDPALFVYMLSYLRTGRVCLPPYDYDPSLWRRLRAECEYYGMDAMGSALVVTRSFPFDPEYGVLQYGVLHWLGRGRDRGGGGCGVYTSPLRPDGARIHASRTSSSDVAPTGDDISAYPAHVAYQPELRESDANNIEAHAGEGSYCDFDATCAFGLQLPDDVRLRPTHVSFRITSCSGKTSWLLEASEGGDAWVELARRDSHSVATSADLWRCCHHLFPNAADGTTVAVEPDRAEALASTVDSLSRRHYSIQTDAFFRSFRFRGLDPPADPDAHALQCFHMNGLELFGDVCQT